MRFLADMGISLRVVEWLRNEGHDATHLRDEGLQRLPNGQIFTKAIDENRVVLTFDLDFGEIVAACHGDIASVVVFRLRNARSANVIARLDETLVKAAESLQSGAIVIVEEFRIRVRQLPIA